MAAEFPVGVAFGVLLVSTAMAVLSWRIVERPWVTRRLRSGDADESKPEVEVRHERTGPRAALLFASKS